MAIWTYSDYVTKPAGSQERLDRLRLHIQEVSGYVVGSKTRDRAKFPPDILYLKMLKAEEQELTEVVAGSSRRGFARNLAAFRS